MQSISYFCPILTQIRIYPQILIRTPQIKFHKNMSSERHVFSMQRQTDRHDRTSGHFLQVPKNSSGGRSFGSHVILFHAFT